MSDDFTRRQFFSKTDKIGIVSSVALVLIICGKKMPNQLLLFNIVKNFAKVCMFKLCIFGILHLMVLYTVTNRKWLWNYSVTCEKIKITLYVK